MTFDPMAREAWAPVPGWDYYWVSNRGQVRKWMRSGYRKLVQGSLDNHGYRIIRMSQDDTDRREYVHRLVLLGFVGTPEPGRDWALHWDDDPANNRLDNLRWGTPQDNAMDRMRVRRERAASRVQRQVDGAAVGVYRFKDWVAS